MIFPDFHLVDYARGDVSRRNNVVPIRDAVADARNGGSHNSYITVFRFPKDYGAHVAMFGSVKGYAGDCYADWLPFDVDREGDLASALRAARGLAVTLHAQFDVREDQVRYFFSGSKGFHLLVPTRLMGDVVPSPRLPAIFRAMALAIAETAGEKIDTSIYDVNRLFRLPDTRHQSSGLWKIELSWDEFSRLSADQITELAKGPRRLTWEPHDWEPVDGLAELYAKCAEDVESRGARVLPGSATGAAETLALALAPAYAEGQRHSLVLAFAGYAAKRHLPRETAIGVVQNLAAGDDEIDDRIQAVEDTYDRVRKGLDVRGYMELGRLMAPQDLLAVKEALGDVRKERAAEKPSQPEPPPDGRVSLKHVYDPDRAGEAYVAYVRRLAGRRVGTGIPTLDRHMRGLMPGTVTILIAKARVGKSAVAQNIRRNIARQARDVCSVFFSMEMPVELVWERDAQAAFEMRGHDVETVMRGASESEIASYITQVSRTTPRCYTVPEPGLTLDEMADYCDLIRETFGYPVGAVIVDYLSLIRGKGKDIYTVTSGVARGLKGLAKEVEAPVIVLHQIRRGQNDGPTGGSRPPALEDARDSGAVEEGADFVIGAWRPKIDAEFGDDVVGFKLLKNRLGRAGVEVMCRIDWKTLSIVELEESPAPEDWRDR